MAITTAPFDSEGNMLHYTNPRYPHPGVMREVTPFPAEMHIVGMASGRSAKYLIVEDEHGHRYPLFIKDLLDIMEGQVIHGLTWEISKRGQNYGIRRAKT